MELHYQPLQNIDKKDMIKINSRYMQNTLILLFFVGIHIGMTAQTEQFGQPLEGQFGKDFVIVNYPDWGTDSIIDHRCGNKTYTGHAGTDIVLRSFPQMDTGVHVIAADSGVVTFIQDGQFDRHTTSVPSRGFGNYVAIRHANNMYTYYAHMKKNSIIVKPGEIVSKGQVIGQVGSSGNSTDPHLHFEVWFDSLYLVDPFMGPCGNRSTLWIDEPEYDTTYHLWDKGLINYIPHIDSLRFRVGLTSEFNARDSIISFWNLQYGIRKGDSTKIKWITPQGDTWFEYTSYYDSDWWYYYYFTFIPRPPMTLQGQWRYEYFRNDSLVASGQFQLNRTVNNIDDAKEEISQRRIGDKIEIDLPSGATPKTVRIYSITGQLLYRQHIDPQTTKVYIDLSSIDHLGIGVLSIRYNDQNYNYKVML